MNRDDVAGQTRQKLPAGRKQVAIQWPVRVSFSAADFSARRPDGKAR
jgi:hypothetical protein